MPIVGLTDTIQSEDYPCGLSIVGKVWKGEKKGKFAPGKDLENRFRVEFDDKRWEQKFLSHYGTLTPETLNIYLPFQSVDRCFEVWYASFTTQGFRHKCDGQRIREKMVQDPYEGANGAKLFHTQKKQVDEPCLKGDKPACSVCGRGSGLLTFYIQELYGSGMGSTRGFRMSLHSINDLASVTSQLTRLQKLYGSLSGSPIPSPLTFGYIPFTLSRVKTSITKPITETKEIGGGKKRYDQTGARSQDEYYAIQIAEDAEWLESLQKFYQGQELLRLAQYPELRQLYGIQSEANTIALPEGKKALPSSSYETSARWGELSRKASQALNFNQIEDAIDEVRQEVSAGMMPRSALDKIGEIANAARTRIAEKPKSVSKPVKREEVVVEAEVVATAALNTAQAQIDELRSLTGHAWKDLKTMAANLELPTKTAEYNETDIDKLCSLMLVECAIAQGLDENSAKNLLQSAKVNSPSWVETFNRLNTNLDQLNLAEDAPAVQGEILEDG
jgi:hypothetical protein